MSTPTTTHCLSAYLHNGASIMLEGNSVAIDIAKGLLIPNTALKGLVTYELTDPPTKLSSLNYTQLKELRGKA